MVDFFSPTLSKVLLLFFFLVISLASSLISSVLIEMREVGPRNYVTKKNVEVERKKLAPIIIQGATKSGV
jgi:hypothetical protein